MASYKNGCLVCGKDLIYFNPAKLMMCQKCGKKFESNASCEDGHFVCDACHANAAYESISNYALECGSADPISIAKHMMRLPFINMHGPEHHYLIVAALLAAYKNAGGDIDLEKALAIALQRAKSVPGGICGLWGSCGAAIGSGIFLSIITEATPLSTESLSLANMMTAHSLEMVAKNGGPRCCKRNTYLSILAAIDFVSQNFHVDMHRPDTILCSFFAKNPTCKKDACILFPRIK